MARKKKEPIRETLVPDPRHLVRIWKWYGGKLVFLSDHPQAGSGYTRVAVIDVGRPFVHHVPSVYGSGSSGLVFEGMTGENAKPWSPSQVLAAARYGLFGFTVAEDT